MERFSLGVDLGKPAKPKGSRLVSFDRIASFSDDRILFRRPEIFFSQNHEIHYLRFDVPNDFPKN